MVEQAEDKPGRSLQLGILKEGSSNGVGCCQRGLILVFGLIVE